MLNQLRRVTIECALLAYAVGALGASLPRDDARDSLVATERAFARYAFEHGIRPAFIEFFADDGVNFQPGPVNTREAYRARPPSDPKRFLLEWHPVLAGVASAGDLGFTSGPSTLSDRSTEPPEVHHGLFFSVWRRDESGVWRVVIDGGVSTPVALPDAAFGAQIPVEAAKRAFNTPVSAGTLISLDTRHAFRNASGIASAEYIALLSASPRLMIDGTPPVIGRDAAAAYLAQRAAGFEWHPIGGRMSRSADLAYSYGRIRFDLAGARAIEAHYIHLWLRDTGGAWKLAVDVILLPPGVKTLGLLTINAK